MPQQPQQAGAAALLFWKKSISNPKFIEIQQNKL
jgi:hypothetical protein